MIKKKEREGLIRGVVAARQAPRISHLFFADDSIIFCRATVDDCKQVAKVLEVYEEESGQKLNKDKTSLFFSRNTKDEMKEFAKGIFGAQIIQHHEKYLGLTPLIGRAKKKAFNRIKDQVGRKIAGWKGKLLSNAGREVLIKAVAHATPTYTMNVFKLPESLCLELNLMMGGFWWGQRGREKKMAWVSWKNLCKPKADGGMGFRDLKAFNLALLAKQGWRLHQNPNSLAHRVLKAKYFSDSSFMEAQLGKKPSYIWRSIMAAKNIIKEDSRWVVGDGKSIELWDARWLPSIASGKVMTTRTGSGHGERVSSLISHEREEWRTTLVQQTFLPHEAEEILSIPLSSMNLADSLVWDKTPNGCFTVKSAYRTAVKCIVEAKEGEANP